MNDFTATILHYNMIGNDHNNTPDDYRLTIIIRRHCGTPEVLKQVFGKKEFAIGTLHHIEIPQDIIQLVM